MGKKIPANFSENLLQFVEKFKIINLSTNQENEETYFENLARLDVKSRNFENSLGNFEIV